VNIQKNIQRILREENLLSLAGNMVVAVAGFAGFALLARSLSLQEFGQWMLFVTAGSLVEMFRFGITQAGLVRFSSGADTPDKRQLTGSNALIGLLSTAFISLTLLLIRFLFSHSVDQSGFALFFKWYPLLAWVNLPWNTALTVLQAERMFGRILLLKALNSLCSLVVMMFIYLHPVYGLKELVMAMILVNALTSFVSLAKGWDGYRLLQEASAGKIKLLLHFGKYTTFTLIGTNLLRSADTLIISMSAMGNAAVALYSIPLKLTELQQIPLRSFAATAFPKMSGASREGNKESVRQIFYNYTGAITILFVFVSLLTCVFAEEFVLLIAGKSYTGTMAVSIVRIFSLYGLLLPLDRMTGIALDSINRPQVNALKVFIMLAANIVVDLIAVFVFQSLLMVAAGSVLFTLVGIVAGMFFLNRELSLRYRMMFTAGITFYRQYLTKLFPGRKKENICVAGVLNDPS